MMVLFHKVSYTDNRQFCFEIEINDSLLSNINLVWYRNEKEIIEKLENNPIKQKDHTKEHNHLIKDITK